MALPENIIPSSEILHETIFTEFKGVNFLPPLLNQADYLREPGLGQCLSVSSVETMQSRLNLQSLKNGKAMPSELSIQQLVDATTPKPVDYKKAVFDYLKENGLVTTADYETALPRPGFHLKNVEGLPTQKASATGSYYCGVANQLQETTRRNEVVDDLYCSGPVIGEMCVTHELMAYKDGIIKGDNVIYDEKTDRALTHASTIIGFGITRDKTVYWVMRNNWGPNFTPDGIYRVCMDNVYNVHIIQLNENEVRRSRRSSQR